MCLDAGCQFTETIRSHGRKNRRGRVSNQVTLPRCDRVTILMDEVWSGSCFVLITHVIAPHFGEPPLPCLRRAGLRRDLAA
jgi:hypothetical protein